MTTAVSTEANPVAAFSRFLDKFKPQMSLALPKHLTADRMTRLALTAFSSNESLQKATPQSIAASVMTASTLGLEPGVNGQGYLVAYYDKRKQANICQFIPGWKGLVDIANRSGRVSVWTGAVFAGDEFDYGLGDRPFVSHKPGDEDSPDKLTHVYAVGRVKGSDWPVIEVWRMSKIWKHRDAYNKVGTAHYSYRDPEMYARKVPLLQVLKYMPSSIELSNAIAATNAAEMSRGVTISGDFVTIEPDPGEGDDHQGQQRGGPSQGERTLPACSEKDFAAITEEWRPRVASKKKKPAEAIAFIASQFVLTEEQRLTVDSWAHEND